MQIHLPHVRNTFLAKQSLPLRRDPDARTLRCGDIDDILHHVGFHVIAVVAVDEGVGVAGGAEEKDLFVGTACDAS